MMSEAAAAKRWNVAVTEVTAINHEVVHSATGRKLGYGELATDAAAQTVVETAALRLKDPKNFRYIGNDDGVRREPGRGEPPRARHPVVQRNPRSSTERQHVGDGAAREAEEQCSAMAQPRERRGQSERVRRAAELPRLPTRANRAPEGNRATVVAIARQGAPEAMGNSATEEEDSGHDADPVASPAAPGRQAAPGRRVRRRLDGCGGCAGRASRVQSRATNLIRT